MYKSNDFWRESEIALESELYHQYWHLSVYEKAWLIAAIETRNDLRNVVDEFGRDEEE